MAELPEGFSWADAPSKRELPEGFAWADEPQQAGAAPQARGLTETLNRIIDKPAPLPGPSLIDMFLRPLRSGAQATQQAATGGGVDLEKAAEAATLALPGSVAGVPGRTGAAALRPRAARELAPQMAEAAERSIAGRRVAPEEAGAALQPLVRNQLAPDLASAQTNEELFRRAFSMASSTNKTDIQTLARARGSLPKEEFGKFRAGVVGEMGRGAEGVFDEATFLKSYGDLSTAGRQTLFGGPGGEALSSYLDQIAAVSRRAVEHEAKSRVRRGIGAAGMAVGAMFHPLGTLKAVIGQEALRQALSSGPGAAATARWSRAWEGVSRKPSAATIGSFNLATRNLAANLGVEIDPEELLRNIPDIKLELPYEELRRREEIDRRE